MIDHLIQKQICLHQAQVLSNFINCYEPINPYVFFLHQKRGILSKNNCWQFFPKISFLYYLEGWAYQDVIWRQKIFFASSRSRLTETIWNSFLFNIETKERLGGTFYFIFFWFQPSFWENEIIYLHVRDLYPVSVFPFQNLVEQQKFSNIDPNQQKKCFTFCKASIK